MNIKNTKEFTEMMVWLTQNANNFVTIQVFDFLVNNLSEGGPSSRMSQVEIAEKLDVNQSNISHSIKELSTYGAITIISRDGNGNLYKINPFKEWQKQ